MKRARRLTHLRLARRALRCAITELRYAAQLEAATAPQRSLITADANEAQHLVADVTTRIKRSEHR